MQGTFRFSFGPWNIHEGADPFGPEVRRTIPFNQKLEAYKKMGFDGVQFHDNVLQHEGRQCKPYTKGQNNTDGYYERYMWRN